MRRLIIHVHDGITDQEAATKVKEVIRQGYLSDNGRCYCYLSKFSDNQLVSCDKNKTGFTFRVWREVNE